MAYIRKAFLKCDRCGCVQEVPTQGWLDLGEDRHPCPSCTGPYLSKKREMGRGLKRLSGVGTAEADI
ncbi:hypothetical protein E5335_02060 [Coriobacteriaceae bacterium]|nr:hypothetical protein E5335_02060 [Coriobacteriaceae bacterium]